MSLVRNNSGTRRRWRSSALEGRRRLQSNAKPGCWLTERRLMGPAVRLNALGAPWRWPFCMDPGGHGSWQQQEWGAHSKGVNDDPLRPPQRDWCQTASYRSFQQGWQLHGVWGGLGQHLTQDAKQTNPPRLTTGSCRQNNGASTAWGLCWQAPVSPPKIALKNYVFKRIMLQTWVLSPRWFTFQQLFNFLKLCKIRMRAVVVVIKPRINVKGLIP